MSFQLLQQPYFKYFKMPYSTVSLLTFIGYHTCFLSGLSRPVYKHDWQAVKRVLLWKKWRFSCTVTCHRREHCGQQNDSSIPDGDNFRTILILSHCCVYLYLLGTPIYLTTKVEFVCIVQETDDHPSIFIETTMTIVVLWQWWTFFTDFVAIWCILKSELKTTAKNACLIFCKSRARSFYEGPWYFFIIMKFQWPHAHILITLMNPYVFIVLHFSSL